MGSLKRGGILRLVTVQRFGHIWSRDHIRFMAVCAVLCVCMERAFGWQTYVIL